MHDILRFITCGSVDDGKSTLIGRLLFESKMIFKDQLNSIEKDSKRYGTTGDEIDLALLVDGLQSEREQGITIDVAYRYFSTKKRKFIIADTPGHEQYTRNMVTGASTADLALILIDARKGVLTQTKRHSYIVSLLGIKNIIVVINKMDLISYSKDKYEQIKKEYKDIIPSLIGSEDTDFQFIPLSALKGDNIVKKSDKMDWYKDKTLIDMLDSAQIYRALQECADFRFPVQYINRPNQNFRGYAGTIASGQINVNDKVIVFPSKKISSIKSIILPSAKELKLNDTAYAPMSVTLTLNDDLDINRGDMITGVDNLPTLSDTLEVYVVWMDEKPMELHNNYIIKRATSSVNAKFISIEYKKDMDSFKMQIVDILKLNDIAKCTLKLDRKIAADRYKDNKYTGSFIIIDKYSQNTVGAGMIIKNIKKETDKNLKIKHYTSAEIELNSYIRKNYPEWGTTEILS